MAHVPSRRPGSDQEKKTRRATHWPAALAEHRRWLRAIVFARVGDPQAVDDILQEVALAVAKQAQTGESPAKPAPWLYQVAVRQSLLYRRRRARQRNLVERFVEQRPPSDHDGQSPDPLQWLLVDERRQRVRQALAGLPVHEAEILLLKYTEDWNYQQIADHLGVSRSAVEARLHRARARLRSELVRLEVVELPR